jgi:hypothetical protein
MNKIFLELFIAELKKKLVENAKTTGINSPQTITCSQQLDNLLNLHMRYFSLRKDISMDAT